MSETGRGVIEPQAAARNLPPVLVWHRRADEYRKLLRQRLPGVPLETCSTGHLPDDARRAEVLLTWTPPPSALDRLPSLRWIHLAGAGADHLLDRDDLDPEVLISKSRGRFGLQAAEYVIGWLLHFLLEIEAYRRDQDRGRWNQRARPLLADATVGVVGLGNVGGTIAERLAGAGAQVLGSCRRSRPMASVAAVWAAGSWREMLPRCDALVLAAPLTEETRGMVDADALAALPDGAILVNVARGGLLVEDDLVAALRNGELRAAVLDAFEEEPLPPDCPLWTEPRVWITPHVAAPSEDDVIADEFADNYRRFLDGQSPEPRVDRTAGY